MTATPSINQAVQNQLKPDFSRIVNILPLLWLIGALVLAVYVGAGNFNLWRIVKRRRPLTDQKILDLLEDCKAQMGIQTILGIVPTDKVESPALFGFVRPRLLLPHGMIETLSQQELRYVLLHELAHLKRHDIYIGWLMTLLSSDEMHIRGAELSSDGKTLFYLGYESTSKNKRLMARDLETGQEKELLQTRSSGTPVLRRWALSPDGQQLVFSTRLKLTDWPWALRIISAKGGESKKLVGGGIGEVAWTADGRDLLFVKDGSELWRVSAEGEEPRKLWEWKESFRDLRVNLDGQHIAFATRGYMYEVWVMENFLPGAPVAKPEPTTTLRRK